MIAAILSSAVDGQRLDLSAVVVTRGMQAKSKTGTPKRSMILADMSGSIDLMLLNDGSVHSEKFARGDVVVVKNAKVSVWNGKVSLLSFVAPSLIDNFELGSWWAANGRVTEPLTICAILTQPDQATVVNVVGLVVSTDDASSTKSGGTKRKFMIADGSTRTPIDVCFVGSHAVAPPDYSVGSVVILASAKVGIWQEKRSLLIFDAPLCAVVDDPATADIRKWICSGGALTHGPVSLRHLCVSADDERFDLRPVVVSRVFERTMTSGGRLWKRTIEVADETVSVPGVEISVVGEAADMSLCVGDVIGIKRAKVCTFNGKRSAVVFDAPVIVTDDVEVKAWWASMKSNHGGLCVGKSVPETRLAHIPSLVEGTRVEGMHVIVVNERTVTDQCGFAVDVKFVCTAMPTREFIRIDLAKVVSGGLEVSAFSEETPNSALVDWWTLNKESVLVRAMDAPSSPPGDWPF